MFPRVRLRRLRRLKIVRETRISVKDLILPVFVDETLEGRDKKKIEAMPGQFRFSLDSVVDEVSSAIDRGISSFLLFGIPLKKDDVGSEAFNSEGIVQRAVRRLKDEFDDIIVITDLCLCEYTTHGHCGLIDDRGEILNDETLDVLGKIAVSQAHAGADIVAPSGMMDGMVSAIRNALDDAGLKNTAIMSYSAKFHSSLYAPFREAAESAPVMGDRSTYQMDFANAREALREIQLDIEEGADIVMVKPALFYLDIISAARARFDVPIAAYNVSGEYSMIMTASERGFIDKNAAIIETLTAIKRAGADIIISYFAKDVADIIEMRGK